MKNSKEYSRKVQKLYRSLKRKSPKGQKPFYEEPVEALVYAIISERMNERAAQSAIRRFSDHFVDLNDLRVSRAEEIVEVLATDTPVTRDIAMALGGALRSVFDRYNTVSLKALRRTGKRPAKQALDKMNGVSTFAVDYCMLTSLQGHAIPLTNAMTDYLRSNELVHPDADEQEIEGFLARQISANNAYEFYALLRRASESYRPRRRKKTTAKTTTEAAGRTKKKTQGATRTKKRKKK
jgi:endonuclease III